VVQKFADSFLCCSVNPFSFAGDCSLIIAHVLGRWIISETQNISGTWTTSFYGYDGHNSVRFLTNANGAVTDNYTFDAFGIKIAGAGTTPNQILYSGEYLDPGTGDYNLRDRIYRQNTGSFMTADTTPGQLPYVYTSDNPVNMVDPSGHIGIVSVVVDFSLSLAVDVRDIAVATYVRAKEIDIVEALGVLADGLTTGYENVFFGPSSLSAGTAFSIGFGAGIVQGLVALDSPATAAGLGTAIVDVGDEAFSNSHNKFSWPFFAHLAADEIFTFGATAVIENNFQELTEAEKFFLSFDISQAYSLAPNSYEYFKELAK
jgi:RHS repeat-associated protein